MMPMLPSRKKDIALLSAIVSTLVLSVFFLAAGFKASSAKQEQGGQKERPAIPDLPIANYEPSEPGSVFRPSARRERDARYDNRGWVREDPNVSFVASSAHWGKGLSALPVGQSDGIVVANVTDAAACLSTDRTGVYSEFTIEVEDVYKGGNPSSISPGKAITITREGGAVRFPSGRIQRYVIAHQGMPRIGGRYVLFLKQVREGESFDILTGYELRNNKVQPLDSLDTFAIYNRVAESDLLAAVRDAVTRAQ